MDADTRTQFKLISEIARLCKSARMRFWLRGGWALDFLIGSVTRSHSDIDLVTWRRHADRIESTLLAAGYRVATVTDQAAIHFTKADQDIGIAFIKKDQEGRFVTPGREFWPWPSFPQALRTLDGVACRTMSVAALLEEKVNYEKYSKRPPRPKDLASIQTLRSLVG